MTRVFDQEQQYLLLQQNSSQQKTGGANNQVMSSELWLETNSVQMPLQDPNPEPTFDHQGPLAVPFFPTNW